jgi:hypothetical protein
MTRHMRVYAQARSTHAPTQKLHDDGPTPSRAQQARRGHGLSWVVQYAIGVAYISCARRQGAGLAVRSQEELEPDGQDAA